MKVLKQLLCLASALLLTTGLFAQSQTVSGVVSNSTGEGIVGAFVVQKGTSNGTQTDGKGAYSIKVPAGSTLEISCIGYETMTVKVGNKTKLDITLTDDAQMLGDAVVIGYGSQSKITLTGSVAKTSGDELVKNSSVNLSQGLAGRMSGVIVNNRSGEPGKDDATMFIRGRST
ncbi:MAG: carboxypeptidase-like regulatory domain-containing protein, partial [Bacteroidales bacterium]|nr:carboxypeptidase-like regulatory domain-containing protein [Bacteroidales bacterium]